MLPQRHANVQETELLKKISQNEDLISVSWAASELLCRLHEDRSSIPQNASAVLLGRLQVLSGAGSVDGAPVWTPPTRGRPLANKTLLGGGVSLAATFQPLTADELEAVSAMLGALLDLIRVQPEDHGLLRDHLLSTTAGDPNCLWLFLRVLATCGGTAGDGSGVQGEGGAAFVHCCHILARLSDGDEEVSRALRSARVLDLLADRLQRATAGEELGTEWLPFATAAVLLLDMLVSADDAHCLKLADPKLYTPAWAHARKPDTTVDALVATLRRSLMQEGGNMVVQPLHLNGLRALGHVALLSGQQAQRMLAMKAPDLAVLVLSTAGADEEAVNIALWFLAVVARGSPFSAPKLAASGAKEAAKAAAARYPRSQWIQAEAERVIQACG
mmetsp:Transcript_7288/g.18185  ORF Transcript_7288/g.18185 Transcript_7288/m.18185 type:complete len:388 (-) Transcript_7288:34-1197(-)